MTMHRKRPDELAGEATMRSGSRAPLEQSGIAAWKEDMTCCGIERTNGDGESSG
jgi:hypothetical protein